MSHERVEPCSNPSPFLVPRLLVMKHLPHSFLFTALISLATATAPAASPGPSGVLGRPAIFETKSTAMAAAAVFADPSKGDDSQDGSEAHPWRTMQHAIEQLRPGQTLYLRGGTYFEHVYCSLLGTAEKPITISGYPGEVAILDGGIPAFETDPATAWEPVEGGAPGEFRSTRTFPNTRDLLGLFADSNAGLQTYWHVEDFRAVNEKWLRDPATKKVAPIYCGPGVWQDRETQRLHIRLQHTHINHPRVKNYTGETDPRKTPLVISAFNSVPLKLDLCQHLRLRNFIIRGGGLNTLLLAMAVHVDFEYVTIHGGCYPIHSKNSGPLTLKNCGVYGSIAPWMFYDENALQAGGPEHHDPFNPEGPTQVARNISRLPTHALVVTEGFEESQIFAHPFNNNWDVSYCNFADSHDGVYINGWNMRFHHNWLGNIQDDATYLSSPTPFVCDNVYVYNNLFTACTTAMGFHTRGWAPGKVFIYGNVVDLRAGSNYQRATNGDPEKPNVISGHFLNSHGREVTGMESIYIYHNTCILPVHSYSGFAGTVTMRLWPESRREACNNIFVHMGIPQRFQRVPSFDYGVQTFAMDGNVHWSTVQPDLRTEDFLATIRAHPESLKRVAEGKTGFEQNSRVADPGFVSFSDRDDVDADFAIRPDGAAAASGVPIKTEVVTQKTAAGNWVSTPPAGELKLPDFEVYGKTAGAIPVGRECFRVGIEGKIRPGQAPAKLNKPEVFDAPPVTGQPVTR